MSDEPKETAWRGFIRKASYQKKGDESWEDIINDAYHAGFIGLYDEAVEKFDEVLRYSYERLDKSVRQHALAAKAVALEELGRDDEALATFDEAIKIDSKNASNFHNKGLLLQEQERYSEALVCFNRAIELSSDEFDDDDDDDDDVRAMYAGSSAALAEIHCELGTKNDLKLAQKYVDKAIKLTPEEPYPYKVQALILAHQTIEKYDEALEYCDKGLKFAPESEDLLSLKGLIYLNMKMEGIAEKYFLKSLDEDPSDENAHYNLACVYSMLDNKQKAIDHLTVAIYLDSGYQENMEDDESFDNIKDLKEFKRLQSLEV